MKKIVYLLSIGIMVSLMGCGNAPIKDTPTSIPTMDITTPVVEVTKPVIVQPTPVVKKVNTTSTPKQVPVVAKKWVVTNTYSGSGMSTKNITITKNVRITWNVTSIAPRVDDVVSDSFNYYLKDSKGIPYAVDLLFAQQNGIGKGTKTLSLDAGQYSLQVNSANCQWTMTVEQQK